MNVTLTQDTKPEPGDVSDDDLDKVVRAAGREFDRLFTDLFGPRPERNWAAGQGAVIYGP